MSANKIKKQVEEEQQEAKKGAKKIFKASEFSFFLTKEKLPTLVPFIMYLTLLAIIYIANSHLALRLVRETDDLTKELKEQRAEYITIRSDLENKSKQSEVAEGLEEIGLKELRTPPFKITVKKNENLEY